MAKRPRRIFTITAYGCAKNSPAPAPMRWPITNSWKCCCFASFHGATPSLLRKRLIDRFGDLGAVLGAPAQRIAEVDGAGDAVALELKLVGAVLARAARGEFTQKPIIGSWTQLVAYCRMTMAHEPREQFRVLFLDIKNQLIADEVLNQGTINHAPVYPREVARRALELSAASVILVHNHPSGDSKPSKADIDITREIIRAADAIGVSVHDHLVIGKAGVASFKTLGLI